MAVRALLHLAHWNLVCSVCYNLFRHPVSFPCGHVFCKSCAERCVDERPHCPLCNHAVSSRRASIPLPMLATLTALIQDVAHSLRLQHTSTITPGSSSNSRSSTPPPLLHLGEAASTVKMTENRSTTASVAASDIACSATSGDDGRSSPRPAISRGGSTPNTQLLHTPQFRQRDAIAAELQWGGEETQLVHSEGPALDTVRLCMAVRRYKFTNTERIPDHSGCCVLCGLDIKDRAQMHHYLRRLLNTDPSCNRGRVRQLSEVAFGTCLGPMWDLHVPQVASTSADRSEKTGGVGEYYLSGDSGRRKRPREEENHLSITALLLVVHQRCLEWCLLHDHIKDDDTPLRLIISNTLFRELSGVSTAAITICSFCASSGMCLLLCGCCQRKAYHYPCALLTGVDVCDISAGVNRLLCAECAKLQQETEERAKEAEEEEE